MPVQEGKATSQSAFHHFGSSLPYSPPSQQFDPHELTNAGSTAMASISERSDGEITLIWEVCEWRGLQSDALTPDVFIPRLNSPETTPPSIPTTRTAPPKIVTLHKSPVSGQPDKEFLLLSIEWRRERGTPAHTHLGDEYGSVIEGSYNVKQGDGDWKTYHPGVLWHVPAGVVHEFKPEISRQDDQRLHSREG